MSFENIFVNEDAFKASVKSLPLRGALFLESSCPLIEAIDLLQEKKLGSLAVTENMKLIGTLSENDLVQKVLLNNMDYHHVSLSEVMSPNPIRITTNDTLKECILKVVKKDFNHFPLVNEKGEPEYVISVRDILRFIMDLFPDFIKEIGTLLDWDEKTFFPKEDRELPRYLENHISGIPFFYSLNLCNSKTAYTINRKASVQEAIQVMKDHNVELLLVCEYGKDILGTFTERDLLQKIINKVDLEGKEIPVTDFMSETPHFLLGKHFLGHAANNLIETGDKQIILIDEDGYPFAFVTMLSIIRFLSHTFFTEE